MKEWLNIAEAAIVAGRGQSTIYRWMDTGKLASRKADDGTIEVASAEVLKAEAASKRGRPRGSVSKVALARRHILP